MRHVVFAGLFLVLAAGCSASSSGKKGTGGTGGGYNTGGSGNVAIGGSGNGPSSGGTGNVGTGGQPPSGGTGGVATGGTGNTGNTGSGGTAPSLDPTCTGLTTTSGGSCYPATPCNPMTQAGCTTPGGACDIAATGFECYPPPNDIAVCGACGDGAFCQAGNVCINSQCLHYCCTDADCGTGKCYDIPLQDSTAVIKACLNTAPPSG
jgi:hypothetical protein